MKGSLSDIYLASKDEDGGECKSFFPPFGFISLIIVPATVAAIEKCSHADFGAAFAEAFFLLLRDLEEQQATRPPSVTSPSNRTKSLEADFKTSTLSNMKYQNGSANHYNDFSNELSPGGTSALASAVRTVKIERLLVVLKKIWSHIYFSVFYLYFEMMKYIVAVSFSALSGSTGAVLRSALDSSILIFCR